MTNALSSTVIVVLAIVIAGCAQTAHYERGEYREGAIEFRTGVLPSTWRRVHVGGGQVTFHHAHGGSIVAAASCGRDFDDVPLDVALNHLLFGIETRSERSRDRIILDGRAALRARIDGTMDGVPVALDLIVSNGDGCTYDLHLVTSREIHDQRRADFDAFVSGFAKHARATP